MIVLRDYQADLIARTRAAMQQGARRVCIQSPTGSGKTALVAQMLASAAARGKRAWFCVHRKELLDQSVQTFIESADIHTGVVAAGYPVAPLAPVQVCSVPSLQRRAASLSPPDLLVWDECHHLASASWSALAGQFPNARHIGLTATPCRLDGRGLGAYFDTLLEGPSTAALMAAGWLSRYRFFAPGAVNMQGVHRVAGDYNRKEAAHVMEHSTVVGDCVSHYRDHCADGRALVFAWSLEASKAIADSFTFHGIEAQHVDGETARSARTDALQRFRSGALRVLCNVDLFGEGLDVPAVDNLFLLRPTASLGLYLQQVGRGLRPAEGKHAVSIFDHVNNWQRHGLPDDPRVWSLDGAQRVKPASEPMGKRCPKCFGISRPSATVCSLCGAVFPIQAREVTQVAGVLQETDPDVLRLLGLRDKPAPRPQSLAEWQAIGRAKNYKPQWAFVMHKRAWAKRA